jgi:hypothetical protein
MASAAVSREPGVLLHGWNQNASSDQRRKVARHPDTRARARRTQVAVEQLPSSVVGESACLPCASCPAARSVATHPAGRSRRLDARVVARRWL